MPAIILFLVCCVFACAFQGDPLCVFVVSIFSVILVLGGLSVLMDKGNHGYKEIKQIKNPINYSNGVYRRYYK
ncbi:MAG: hypothetical protein MJ032_02470 [Acidaminococcaceae bacterium]|nr:hypothetical protein [Acidaminococcaceae bacterium]